MVPEENRPICVLMHVLRFFKEFSLKDNHTKLRKSAFQFYFLELWRYPQYKIFDKNEVLFFGS